jgi:hypothetical protein
MNINNPKILSLIVKCHGINEEKVINVNLSKSIGVLKHDCIVAFNVPIEFKKFIVVFQMKILKVYY